MSKQRQILDFTLPHNSVLKLETPFSAVIMNYLIMEKIHTVKNVVFINIRFTICVPASTGSATVQSGNTSRFVYVVFEMPIVISKFFNVFK